jgi:hypothetical protein
VVAVAEAHRGTQLAAARQRVRRATQTPRSPEGLPSSTR